MNRTAQKLDLARGPTVAGTEDRRPGLAFRPDIEGLRAIAVGLVVLLHAGVTTVSGGYVGVDVFFVISGFLITSLLLDELRRTHRVSMLGFYARRARRILPAASCVIAATVVATYLVLGPLYGRSTATDGGWAAIFAANFRFIHQGTGYFTSNLPPSPLLHYWSLAVEEQFYLVWPSLLLGLVAVGRYFGRTLLALRCGLMVLVGGSLYWSIHETSLHPTGAYFSPLTRTWELGVGALIATFVTVIAKLPAPLRATATWAGLAAISVAALSFTSATAFPGYAALLPVLGAAAIIAGGIDTPAGSAGRVLGNAPMRSIGKISFSIYLWHFPVFIIAQQRTTSPLTNWERAACVLLTVGLATVTYLAVEHPLRSSSLLRARHPRTNWQASRRSLAAGFLAIALALGVAGATGSRAALAISGAGSTKFIATESLFAPAKSDKTESVPARATAADPAAAANEHFLVTQRAVVDAVRAAARLTKVPSNVDPPVLQLKQLGNPFPGRCMNDLADTKVTICYLGDRSARRTVFIVGDSHAVTWLPALDIWGKRQGFRIASLSKAACTVARTTKLPDWFEAVLPDGNKSRGIPYPECKQWRDAALEAVVAAKPDLILLANEHNTSTLSDRELHDGYLATFRELARAGSRIIQIGDNPTLAQDPAICLSQPGADPSACAGKFDADSISGDVATAGRAGVYFVNVEPWFCASVTNCPLIIDDRIAYVDVSHISSTYAQDLAPVLGAALDAIVAAK